MLDELSTPAEVPSRRQRAVAAWSAIRAQPRRAAFVAIVAAVVAVALWWLLRPPPPIAPEALLPVATTAAATPSSIVDHPSSAGRAGTAAPPSTLVVHVAGAVLRPGVLRLPVGSRVVDAIDAAGGAVGDADVDRINLAAIVADARHMYPRAVGEAPASPPANSTGAGGGASNFGATTTSPLDLNAATVEQLDSLPGIGPATAAAIIDHRTRNGPFTKVDSLSDVPGIGPAKLERLRPLVRV